MHVSWLISVIPKFHEWSNSHVGSDLQQSKYSFNGPAKWLFFCSDALYLVNTSVGGGGIVQKHSFENTVMSCRSIHKKKKSHFLHLYKFNDALIMTVMSLDIMIF